MDDLGFINNLWMQPARSMATNAARSINKIITENFKYKFYLHPSHGEIEFNYYDASLKQYYLESVIPGITYLSQVNPPLTRNLNSSDKRIVEIDNILNQLAEVKTYINKLYISYPLAIEFQALLDDDLAAMLVKDQLQEEFSKNSDYFLNGPKPAIEIREISARKIRLED